MGEGREKSTPAGSESEDRIPYWRLIVYQGVLTPRIINYSYKGSGTEDDPYVVQWLPNDPRNPMLWPKLFKWSLTLLVSIATLAVALVSSAYTGGLQEILKQFQISSEIGTLGVSLFVLGFAVGPLIWAPLSEMYGRQILFIVSYGGLTAFNAGVPGAKNAWTLIILRFFAGAFGSSPLTNAGGVIADMFPASERGLAMSLFAAAPFLGPVLGPIIGGFLGMNAGWKWVMGFLAAFSGALWIICSLFVPETYGPVLLQRRAEALSKISGKVYRSELEVERGKISPKDAFKTSLSRPWILLFREPIVILMSIYMAIVYGTLYMMFGAFPIVFQGERHWNQGISGLAFLGVMMGMIVAVIYTIFDNKRYVRTQERHQGFAPPEARLPPGIVGSIAIPLGLFWFAWTTFPSIHWIVCIIATAPFGFGMVLVFLSIMNYLIDSYTIYAASVLAANSILRSIFGAVFPLFTKQMYAGVGTQWASSIPAFLSLACVPFPFLFYKYGAKIRLRCKYAAESEAFMRRMAERMVAAEDSSHQDEDPERGIELSATSQISLVRSEKDSESGSSLSEVRELGNTITRRDTMGARSTHSRRSSVVAYEGNPYDSISPVTTRVKSVGN